MQVLARFPAAAAAAGAAVALLRTAVLLFIPKESKLPLLKTSGKVDFNVKGWNAAYTDGGIVSALVLAGVG